MKGHNTSYFLKSEIIGISFILVAAILQFCGPANKPFEGAILSSLKGTVVITRLNKEEYQLKEDMLSTKQALVGIGDTIITKDNSFIDLQYDTGVSMRLGPNSHLVIEKSELQKRGGNADINVRLDSGRLLTKSEKQLSGSSLRVQTPTLVASVRGTEFLVKPDEEVVMVDEGSIEIAIPEIDETTIVEEGNKAENNNDTNSVEVSPLDENDKQELDEMSEGLDYINEDARQQLDKIVSIYQEEKERIRSEYQQQVDRNKETMESEKNRQKDEFDAEKSRITGESDPDRAERENETRNAMDRIKNPQ